MAILVIFQGAMNPSMKTAISDIYHMKCGYWLTPKLDSEGAVGLGEI